LKKILERHEDRDKGANNAVDYPPPGGMARAPPAAGCRVVSWLGRQEFFVSPVAC